MLPSTITLRPIGPDDHDFLYRVYANTRYEELAPVGWPDSVRDAFLAMQFQAQHDYYQTTFSDAQYDLILRDGLPIGRLYVQRRSDELHIIDIALLPAYRHQGIGTGLMQTLLAEAKMNNLPVRLYVEQNNTALGWYQRLGFRQIGDHGIYLLMERTPDNALIE